MMSNIEAFGVDIILEDTGHLSPHYIAPVLSMLIAQLFRKGFDETASVKGEVKDGVFSLTISKPAPEVRAVLKNAYAKALVA